MGTNKKLLMLILGHHFNCPIISFINIALTYIVRRYGSVCDLTITDSGEIFTFRQSGEKVQCFLTRQSIQSNSTLGAVSGPIPAKMSNYVTKVEVGRDVSGAACSDSSKRILMTVLNHFLMTL